MVRTGDLGILWGSVKPVALGRVAVLRRALDAAERRQLDAGLLSEAATDAHRLAGSLGMYGLGDASRLAGEIDRLIDEGGLGAGSSRVVLAGAIADLARAVEEDR